MMERRSEERVVSGSQPEVDGFVDRGWLVGPLDAFAGAGGFVGGADDLEHLPAILAGPLNRFSASQSWDRASRPLSRPSGTCRAASFSEPLLRRNTLILRL